MQELNETIEAHIPRLRRYARALLGDHVRADDLVQDTLERACRKWRLWRRGSDLRAWLFTLMHNVFVNQVRTRKVAESWLPLHEQTEEPAARATQDDGLELRDLMSAIGRLPPEFREVVLLIGLEQLSYAEVAQVLNIPLGTVMSRLARGRERLRVLIAQANTPALRRVK